MKPTNDIKMIVNEFFVKALMILIEKLFHKYLEVSKVLPFHAVM